MYSWAEKRRATIVSILIVGLFLFLVFSWRIIFYTHATCTDSVQNNGERGIDCGGSCVRLCAGEALTPIVHFTRAVETDKGVWGAVAYLENRTKGAGARSAPYVIKLYDVRNLLVAERHGVASVPSETTFAIFEGALMTGDRVPSRATFEFSAPLVFERVSSMPALRQSNQRFESGTVSRFDVMLANPSLTSLSHISVTVLLFDQDGNVFAASETEVPSLSPLGSVPLSFTWPRALATPARIELLSRVLVQ